MNRESPVGGEGQADKSRPPTLTKTDLAIEVARALEVPLAEGARIVENIFDGMVRALRRGEKIELRGFGSFHLRQRRARRGRNPKTGARVEVAAKKIAHFKAGKELKDLINVA
jgi:integration host factor subunit beta